MRAAAIVLALCAPAVARAQPINLSSLDDEPNRVHVMTGAEYAFVAGAGYSRIVSVLERKLVVTGSVAVPWAHPDLEDFSLRAGALVPVVQAGGFKVGLAASPILRGTSTLINRMTSLGIDAGVTAGYHVRRWFAAVETGVDLALTTHVAHHDAYRMASFAEARDGWYANTAGNLRAGVQAGVTFGRYDVGVRAGRLVDVGGGPPLIPYYATLTADARW